MRHFGRELVDLEGAQQADDSMRNALADLGQGVELRRFGIGEPVEASVYLLEITAVTEPLQVRPRDASCIEITGPDRPFASELEQSVHFGRRPGHGTNR